MFPASANGTDVAPAPGKNQSTASLKWKGDFELRFVNHKGMDNGLSMTIFINSLLPT
jgi:hypothetical protein